MSILLVAWSGDLRRTPLVRAKADVSCAADDRERARFLAANIEKCLRQPLDR